MATQTKVYRIKYREGLMDEFKALENAESSSYDNVVEQAKNYAEEHPGFIVKVLSNTDGFEIQFKVKPDGHLYHSFGSGWIY